MAKKYTITIGKTGHSLNVDWDDIPANSQDYAIQYGLRQSLNDAAASFKKADYDDESEFKDAVNHAADSRLAKLYEGTPPRAGSRTTDPVTKRMKLLATEFITRQMPGVKGDEKRDAIAAVMDGNADALRETATRQLADEAGMTIALPKGLAEK